METFLARQQRFNRQTADNWARAEPHRTLCSDLLRQLAAANAPTAQSAGRLCLLGAGTCNDVDLAALSTTFAEISLVDFDAAAMDRGIEQQSQSNNPAIRTRVADVTGCATDLDQLTPQSSPEEVRHVESLLQQRVQHVVDDLGNGYDVAVSLCLLSQLVQQVVERLSENHPSFVEMLQAVRISHLRVLLNLVRPGGRAVLITDVVSSDTVPQLSRLPREELLPLIAALIPSRNFFSGLNPFILHQLFTGPSPISPLVSQVEPLMPWTWQLGERTYLVCGFVALRSEAQDVDQRLL
jgi:hypothetical protein